MTLVLPFHTGDVMAAKRLMSWIADLGGCKGHDCLLMADADTPYEHALDVKNQAILSFDSVVFHTNGTSVRGWIPGSNSLFFSAAHRLQGRPFFFLEPDAVPLRSGWLDAIQAEYAKCGKPFMGALIKHDGIPTWANPYMEGVAVYPQDAYSRLAQFLNADVSWTNTTADHVVPNCQNTDLIHHIWGEAGHAPVFAEKSVDGTGIFCPDDIRKGAVVFHRNKDGSLIKLLRRRRGIDIEPEAKVVSKGRIVVRRTGALGDVLAATCVADKLHDMGYEVTWQSHPACHCLTRRVSSISASMTPDSPCDINLDGAYENHPERAKKSFGDIFLRAADQQLAGRGIHLPSFVNFAPTLVLQPHESDDVLAQLAPHPKPWVMICPRSNSHINRTVQDALWTEIAGKINGTCFWTANHAPAPPGIVDLNCRHVDRLIHYIAHCDVMCSVDSGPLHIACALGKPAVAIEQASSPEVHISDQRDFVVVKPQLTCLNCQDTVCKLHLGNPPCQIIDSDLVANAVNWKVSGIYNDTISAAICIFRPPASRLNRCITHVIDQVDEVVVSVDGEGIIPDGAIRNPKIKYVRNRFGRRLGYAKNMNHCVRHTSGRWVLLLNDDVFLAADAVEKMREVASDDVGLVGQLLRYPDGTIQHGGTYRNPGDIGFGHLDHKVVNPRITEPVEMENITLASALVLRKAFYQIHGFDELYDCYCEDNDLCMKIRQAGWRIIYQPQATGIHEESQTTRLLPDIRKTMERSCRIFGEKWSWYFSMNNKPGLGVFQ